MSTSLKEQMIELTKEFEFCSINDGDITIEFPPEIMVQDLDEVIEESDSETAIAILQEMLEDQAKNQFNYGCDGYQLQKTQAEFLLWFKDEIELNQVRKKISEVAQNTEYQLNKLSTEKLKEISSEIQLFIKNKLAEHDNK